MATTCDYCHKPLSLMRRLRGEQFCSVEHLDLYTAQQAEFALQRLAASIEERPAAPRPAALLKRLARPATETANGSGHPDQVPTGRVDVATEEIPNEGASPEFLRLARSLEDPKPVQPLLRRLAQDPALLSEEPLVIRPVPEREYPLAGFVPQASIAAQTPAAEETRTDIERIPFPAAARIPADAPTPVSGLLAEVLPAQLEASAALRSVEQIEIAAEMPEVSIVNPVSEGLPDNAAFGSAPLVPFEISSADDAAKPVQAVVPEPLPLPANPRLPVSEPAEDLTVSAELSGLLSIDVKAWDSAPRAATSETTREAPDLAVVRPAAAFLFGEPELAPAELISPPQDTRWDAASRSGAVTPEPVSFDAQIHSPSTRSRGSMIVPETLPVRPLPVRPLSDSAPAGPNLELPRLFPATRVLASPPDSLAEVSVHLVSGTRLDWNGSPLPYTVEPCSPVDALGPTVVHGWPSLPEWALDQSLITAAVPVEAVTPQALAFPTPGGRQDWMPPAGEVRAPRLGRSMPHLNPLGPSFGWEQASPRRGVDVTAPVPVPQAFPAIPESFSSPAVPKPALADIGRTRSVWDQPRGEAVEFRIENEPSQGQVVSPRVRELRARVLARLEATRIRTDKDWSTPRQDSTGVEPCLSVNDRPSAAAPDIRVRPMPAYEIARLHAAPRRSYRASLEVPVTPTAPMQPVRYSPAALTSIPGPNYRLQAPEITEEGRFVAQAPKGSAVFARLRHVGYRMPGPYPKIPRCMPDSYLAQPVPEPPPGKTELILDWSVVRRDPATCPILDVPGPARVHPADYFHWPAIRSPRTDRVFLMRDIQDLLGHGPAEGPVRRFGPARSGLQGRGEQADQVTRAGA